MLKSEYRRQAREAYHTKIPMKKLASVIGIHYTKVREFWIEEFGPDAISSRGKISPNQFEELKPRLRAEFHTSVGMKNLARGVGISHKKLRDFWVEEFGEDILRKRADRINVETAAKVGRDKKGCTHRSTLVSATCIKCSGEFEKSQFSRIEICPSCVENRDGKKETPCPVCEQMWGTLKGVEIHIRHNLEDPSHRKYWDDLLLERERKKWEGKSEGEDYVVCKICNQRAKTLARHLKAEHGITAYIYKKRFPGALIRSSKLREYRGDAIREAFAENPTKGLTKKAKCQDCGTPFPVSIHFNRLSRAIRCQSCRELKIEAERLEYEKQWESKSEPEDYVTCQLCGHKSVNLSSHIQSVHPIQMESYIGQFPDHEMMALCCSLRSKEHWAKNYTKEQLLKYADEKGEVIVIDAEVGLGCSWLTIHRYCKQHGLKTRNLLAFQKSVLEHVKQALNGADYEWEHRDPGIRSLKNSRYLLSFDGYFPDYNLIVEAHGKQHFERIPYFHKYDGDFEYGQRLDQHKRESAIELGYTYLEVRYDEPYTDLRHIRTRLRDLQVEIVGKRSRSDSGVVSDRNRTEEGEMDFEDLAGNQ